LSARLQVRLGPSRRLAAAVLGAHAAALGAALVALPAAAGAIVAAGLALSAFEHVRRALHRSPLAIAGLELGPDGAIAVAGPLDAWAPAEVLSAAVPAPWLAVLVVRDGRGRRRSAVVLADGVEPDAFRRLRVWLRWRSPAAVDPDGDPARR
jgi:toxin CptA